MPRTINVMESCEVFEWVGRKYNPIDWWYFTQMDARSWNEHEVTQADQYPRGKTWMVEAIRQLDLTDQTVDAVRAQVASPILVKKT